MACRGMSVYSRLHLPGKDPEEALDNIKEAIEGCLEVMEERVKAISGKQMMEVVV